MNGRSSERFRGWEYLLFAAAAVLTLLLSVCVGSVAIPFRTTVSVIWRGIWSLPQMKGTAPAILLTSRLPRVLAVMLVGSTAPTITWPAGITSWVGGSAPEISAS